MSRQIGLDPVRVVVGIIKREQKLLVCERPPSKPYSGYWEFPGGKIEQNEFAQDALRRELYEELGITILSSEALFEHTHVYPDKTVLLHIYLVEKFSGEPEGREQQTLRWVNQKELQGLRLLEGNWPIMNKIRELF